MNPHKLAWQESISGVVKRDIRNPIMKIRALQHYMWKAESDKTKWERIGRPLFVDTPLDVLDWYFRFRKAKKALDKIK